MDNSTAYLYNDGEYSIFSFGNVKLKFLTSKNLEKYINVKEWDNGYLVVTKKNIGKSERVIVQNIWAKDREYMERNCQLLWIEV